MRDLGLLAAGSVGVAISGCSGKTRNVSIAELNERPSDYITDPLSGYVRTQGYPEYKGNMIDYASTVFDENVSMQVCDLYESKTGGRSIKVMNMPIDFSSTSGIIDTLLEVTGSWEYSGVLGCYRLKARAAIIKE